MDDVDAAEEMKESLETTGLCEISDNEPHECNELLKLANATIEGLCRSGSAATTSWFEEAAASDSHSGTISAADLSHGIVARFQQLVVYCARQGLINELHYLFSILPAGTSPWFLLHVIEETPVSISPSLYKDLLPSVSARTAEELFPGETSEFPRTVHDALTRGWNEEIECGPGDVQLSVEHKGLEMTHAGLAGSSVLVWYLRLALRFDSLGYPYHGYQTLTFACSEAASAPAPASPHVVDEELIADVRNAFYHFCHLLYDNILPDCTTLLAWLASSLEEKVALVAKHNYGTDATGSPMSLVEMLTGYLWPMLHGDLAVQQSWQRLVKFLSDRSALTMCTAGAAQQLHLRLRCAQQPPSEADALLFGAARDWQNAAVLALAQTVSPMDLPSLQRIVTVAVRSKPTLPLQERCLSCDYALMELVVRSCYRYDDIHSGLEAMWQLIECTPTDQLEAHPEHAGLSDELDLIQRALSTCELLRLYLPVPALSVLVSPSAGDVLRPHQQRRSASRSKMARFRYTQHLLSGCSFLFDRVEAARSECGEAAGVKSSHFEERADRRIKFGQAIALKICYDFGERLETARRDGAMSFLVSNTWFKLCEDLVELCRVSVFQDELALPWVGELVLACLLHFRASELKSVLSRVFSTAASQDSTSGTGRGASQSPKKDLGALLATTFGVTAAAAQQLLVNHARHLTNSVASCCDAEAKSDLKSARELLKHVPESLRTAEMHSELRLHELLSLVASIDLDFIPLQLRLRSPLDIARKIFSERPDSYYALVLNDPSHREGEPVDSYGMAGAKKAVSELKTRAIPGTGFIDLLLGLNPKKGLADAEAEEDFDEELTDQEQRERLVLLLAGASLAVGNTTDAYCFCNYLLEEYRFNTAESALQDEIVGTATLVMESLTNAEYQGSADLGRALRDDLLCSITTNGSIEQFDRLCHLWRSAEPLQASASRLHDVVEDKLNPIDNAKVLLYEAMATLLRRGRSSAAVGVADVADAMASHQSVLEETSVMLTIQEALCYMTQAPDPAAVVAVLDNMLVDIRRKISQVQQALPSGKGGLYEAPPDEKIIEQLVSKGFARNGAKRAVVQTRAVSFNAALAWAIEHCGDSDFDHPMAQQVRGAILVEESARKEASLRNLNESLALIEFTSDTFRLQVGLPRGSNVPALLAVAHTSEDASFVQSSAAALPVSSEPTVDAPVQSPPSERVSRKVDRGNKPAKSTKKVTKVSLGARRLIEPEPAEASGAQSDVVDAAVATPAAQPVSNIPSQEPAPVRTMRSTSSEQVSVREEATPEPPAIEPAVDVVPASLEPSRVTPDPWEQLNAILESDGDALDDLRSSPPQDEFAALSREAISLIGLDHAYLDSVAEGALLMDEAANVITEDVPTTITAVAAGWEDDLDVSSVESGADERHAADSAGLEPEQATSAVSDGEEGCTPVAAHVALHPVLEKRTDAVSPIVGAEWSDAQLDDLDLGESADDLLPAPAGVTPHESCSPVDGSRQEASLPGSADVSRQEASLPGSADVSQEPANLGARWGDSALDDLNFNESASEGEEPVCEDAAEVPPHYRDILMPVEAGLVEPGGSPRGDSALDMLEVDGALEDAPLPASSAASAESATNPSGADPACEPDASPPAEPEEVSVATPEEAAGANVPPPSTDADVQEQSLDALPVHWQEGSIVADEDVCSVHTEDEPQTVSEAPVMNEETAWGDSALDALDLDLDEPELTEDPAILHPTTEQETESPSLFPIQEDLSAEHPADSHGELVPDPAQVAVEPSASDPVDIANGDGLTDELLHQSACNQPDGAPVKMTEQDPEQCGEVPEPLSAPAQEQEQKSSWGDSALEDLDFDEAEEGEEAAGADDGEVHAAPEDAAPVEGILAQAFDIQDEVEEPCADTSSTSEAQYAQEAAAESPQPSGRAECAAGGSPTVRDDVFLPAARGLVEDIAAIAEPEPSSATSWGDSDLDDLDLDEPTGGANFCAEGEVGAPVVEPDEPAAPAAETSLIGGEDVAGVMARATRRGPDELPQSFFTQSEPCSEPELSDEVPPAALGFGTAPGAAMPEHGADNSWGDSALDGLDFDDEDPEETPAHPTSAQSSGPEVEGLGSESECGNAQDVSESMSVAEVLQPSADSDCAAEQDLTASDDVPLPAAHAVAEESIATAGPEPSGAASWGDSDLDGLDVDELTGEASFSAAGGVEVPEVEPVAEQSAPAVDTSLMGGGDVTDDVPEAPAWSSDKPPQRLQRESPPHSEPAQRGSGTAPFPTPSGAPGADDGWGDSALDGLDFDDEDPEEKPAHSESAQLNGAEVDGQVWQSEGCEIHDVCEPVELPEVPGPSAVAVQLEPAESGGALVSQPTVAPVEDAADPTQVGDRAAAAWGDSAMDELDLSGSEEAEPDDADPAVGDAPANLQDIEGRSRPDSAPHLEQDAGERAASEPVDQAPTQLRGHVPQEPDLNEAEMTAQPADVQSLDRDADKQMLGLTTELQPTRNGWADVSLEDLDLDEAEQVEPHSAVIVAETHFEGTQFASVPGDISPGRAGASLEGLESEEDGPEAPQLAAHVEEEVRSESESTAIIAGEVRDPPSSSTGWADTSLDGLDLDETNQSTTNLGTPAKANEPDAFLGALPIKHEAGFSDGDAGWGESSLGNLDLGNDDAVNPPPTAETSESAEPRHHTAESEIACPAHLQAPQPSNKEGWADTSLDGLDFDEIAEATEPKPIVEAAEPAESIPQPIEPAHSEEVQELTSASNAGWADTSLDDLDFDEAEESRPQPIAEAAGAAESDPCGTPIEPAHPEEVQEPPSTINTGWADTALDGLDFDEVAEVTGPQPIEETADFADSPPQGTPIEPAHAEEAQEPKSADNTGWGDTSLDDLDFDEAEESRPQPIAETAGAAESNPRVTPIEPAHPEEVQEPLSVGNTGWGDTALDDLEFDEADRPDPAAAVLPPAQFCGEDTPPGKEPVDQGADPLQAPPTGVDGGWGDFSLDNLDLGEEEEAAEAAAEVQLPAAESIESHHNGAPSDDLRADDAQSAQPVSSAGWADTSLDGLEFEDSEEDNALAEEKAGLEEEAEADDTAVIESALEIAAEVLGLPGAAFNATKTATHIAAFDPALHASAESPASAGVWDTDNAGDTTDDVLSSMVAVYHMCRSLVHSGKEVAFDCLLQLVAAIPYGCFHHWLADAIEANDLQLRSADVQLPEAWIDGADETLWHIHALKFKIAFLGNDASGADFPKVVLWRDPNRCVLLLGQLYRNTAGRELAKLEFLKKAAVELLTSAQYADGNQVNVSFLHEALAKHSTFHPALAVKAAQCCAQTTVPGVEAAAALECVRRQLSEDTAMLRRISRVEEYNGVDCKAILHSGSLLFSPEVFAGSADEDAVCRLAALRSLCPVLRLHTVVSWNRAIGRILDVGPSQLHAYFALHQLSRYANAAEMSVQELALAMAEAVSKMKALHTQVLCLRIAGVAAARVEELKKFSLQALCADNADPAERDEILSLLDVEVLLSTVSESLTKSAVSSSDSAPPPQGGRTARSGAEEKSATSAEVEQSLKLIYLLTNFRSGIADLPRSVHRELLGAGFANQLAIKESIQHILLDEEISADAVQRACGALLRDHAELCSQLNKAGETEESGKGSGSFAPFIDAALVATLGDAVRGQDGLIDTTQAFEVQCSALRSLVAKATICLREGELRVFLQTLLSVLSCLEAELDGGMEGGAPIGALGDVCYQSMSSWLASGLIRTTAQNLRLYAGIHILTVLGTSGSDVDPAVQTNAFAVRTLLLARCLMLDLYRACALPADVLRALTLSCSAVQIAHALPAAGPVYDIMSAEQWSEVLAVLLGALRLCQQGEHAARSLLTLHRLGRLLHDHSPASTAGAFEGPVNFNFVRAALAVFTQSVFRHIPGQAALAIKAVEYITECGEYSAAVEFLLLDMSDARTACGAEVAAKRDEIICKFPERSSWRRQASLILGGDQAEASYAELEQILLSRGKGEPLSSDEDEVLSVLLVLWAVPSAGILQRALASPVIYPLLASLVLQCDRGAALGVSAEDVHPTRFSLQTILHRALRGSSAAAPRDSLQVRLPGCLCSKYLVAALVQHGRIAAAAELCWQGAARPVRMYTAEAGLAYLVHSLQNWVSEGSIYSTGLEIVLSACK